MTVNEKINFIQNKILGMYNAINNCKSAFFIECMFHCIIEEKRKLRKLKQKLIFN